MWWSSFLSHIVTVSTTMKKLLKLYREIFYTEYRSK